MTSKGSPSNLRVYIALLSGMGFMCFAAIFIKAANAPGIVTAFYRMGIAAIILFIPFLIHVLSPNVKLSRKGILFASLAGICFGIDMSLWATGVVHSNATLPTLTANLAPIWVGIGSMFLFKEVHKTGYWIGLAVALGGVLILISKDITESNGIIAGVLLGLGAGIFYSGFYLFAQPGRKIMDTLSFHFISTFSSAVVLLLLVLIFGYDFFGYDRNTTLIFFAISIGVQVFGWFLISYSQGHLPASIIAPTLLGQPVVTAILASAFLNEQLTVLHISGGLVVVGGIYIVHYYRK